VAAPKPPATTAAANTRHFGITSNSCGCNQTFFYSFMTKILM
jgi:hypothetical protein